MPTHLKTPITYYGGKQKMLRHILPRIPTHVLYAESFCGGAAVFFAKAPSLVEVLNDVNGEVMNFYTVLQQHFPALRREVAGTLHSRRVHEDARVVYGSPHLFSPVRRAWAFWVLSVQSYGASLDGGWKFGKRYKNVAQIILSKKRHLKRENLNRTENVQLECADALRIITRYDGPTFFFYCDPPYFNADCGHYRGYTKTDFDQLQIALAGIKGKFLLSAYPSDLLTRAVKANGWYTIAFSSKLGFGNKEGVRRVKTELLVANYPL